MKKFRIMSALLATAALATTSIGTLAEETKTFDQDSSSDKDRQTTVTLQNTNQKYTVSIPAEVTLSNTAATTQEISLTKDDDSDADELLLAENKTFNIDLTSANGFKLKTSSDDGAKINYTVTKQQSIDGTPIDSAPVSVDAENANILSFDTGVNGSYKTKQYKTELEFSQISYKDTRYTNEYTDTLTFTVSVANTES